MMRKLQARTIEALYQEVHRVGGDEASAVSELNQFQQSLYYRRGLRRDFEQRYHRKPGWAELVKYWFLFTRRRARTFRSTNGAKK